MKAMEYPRDRNRKQRQRSASLLFSRGGIALVKCVTPIEVTFDDSCSTDEMQRFCKTQSILPANSNYLDIRVYVLPFLQWGLCWAFQ